MSFGPLQADLGILTRLRQIPFLSCCDTATFQKYDEPIRSEAMTAYFTKILDHYAPLDQRPRVLDVTYGVGKFYLFAKQYMGELWGVDVRRWTWRVKPDKFILGQIQDVWPQLPEQYFDIMVADPPYPVESTFMEARARAYRYLYFNSRDYVSIINCLPNVAKHAVKKRGYVIVKCMDVHCEGELVWEHSHAYIMDVMRNAGIRPVDVLVWRCIMRWRVMHGGRNKVHTYYLVFRRP